MTPRARGHFDDYVPRPQERLTTQRAARAAAPRKQALHSSCARVDRIVNIALAIAYALTIIAGAIGEWNYYLLGSAVEVALLAAIVYYAWTWAERSSTNLHDRTRGDNSRHPTDRSITKSRAVATPNRPIRFLQARCQCF
jgi:hypothetical protein